MRKFQEKGKKLVKKVFGHSKRPGSSGPGAESPYSTTSTATPDRDRSIDAQATPSQQQEMHATPTAEPSPSELPSLPNVNEIHTPDETLIVLGRATEEAGNAMVQIRSPGGGVMSVASGVDAATSGVEGMSSTLDTWDQLLNKVGIFASLIETIGEIHPYAKMASSILLGAVKPILSQDERDKSMQKLLETMNDIYGHVNTSQYLKNLDIERKSVLQRMSLQTVECAHFIRDYAKVKNFWLRAAKNVVSGTDVDDQITKYMATFGELQNAFTTGGVLRLEITTMRILDDLEAIGDNVQLEKLIHVRAAGMNTSKTCLPGTRTQTLEIVSEWVNDTNSTRVCFLVGGAGAGKSAIAHAIGYQFQKLRRLGSFFCFDRSFQTERRPESVFSTIAYNLANWDPGCRRALASVIRENAWLVDAPGIDSQWENLIVKPAGLVTVTGPVLVIIDAFDESGDRRSRTRLLTLLAQQAQELPSNFRILITSRREADVLSAINANPLVYCVYLDSQRTEATADIGVYIEHTLSQADSAAGRLDDSNYKLLTKKVEGLFQWAFTACEVLLPSTGGQTLKECFDSLLSAIDNTGLQPLDTLYSGILEQAFGHDSNTVARFCSVMAQILSASEPLSINALHELRCCGSGTSVDEVNLVVRYLGALLSGVGDRETPIRPFHTSFRDFLTTKERSRKWHVNQQDADYTMALGSVQVMNKHLRFNICHLESFYILNRDVLDLSHRLNEAAAPVLLYSARHWQNHLGLQFSSSDIQNALHVFIHNKVLFWLELLSVMGEVNRAGNALRAAARYLKNDSMSKLLAFIQDAQQFVSRFGGLISESAPHIYHSAIPFTPTSSVLRKHYLSKLPCIPRIHNHSLKWPIMQNVLRGHTSSVTSVACSPSGTHIISGSYDKTIRIWDAETGHAVGQPLEGHTNGVTSV
ncbi:hypothetical protein OF83DRAFT_1272573, partial [Amylostereum chailletii]